MPCTPYLRELHALALVVVFAATISMAVPAAASGPAAASVSIRNIRVSHDTYLAHSEPALAENPTNHRNLVAGSKMFTDPAHYAFKIGTYYALDAGKTWHDSGLLPGFGSYRTTSDVVLAFSKTGTVYATVLAVNGAASGIFVSRSGNGGRSWSAPAPVFLDDTGATFSDKPWIVVDQTNGDTSGNIYVAWNLDSSRDADSGAAIDDYKTSGPYSPNQVEGSAPVGMVLARSTDGGRSFSAPVRLDVFDQLFGIGAVPAVGPHGAVYVVYAKVDNTSGVVRYLSLVTSHDGGATFGPPVIIADVRGLPNHLSVGTFRNLSLPTFAVSPKDGSLIVAWADLGNSDADILASNSTDGGLTWSAGKRVNHDRVNNGKDQFQPALAVSADGVVTCAWFDRRHDPNNRLIDEEIAQSRDDGRTFGRNFRVTTKSWDPAIGAPLPEGKPSNTFIGDYQALAVDNSAVHPLWNDTQNGRSQEIRTAAVSVCIFLTRVR